MAKLSLPMAELREQFGPHLNASPPGGWAYQGQPDRLVATHCCFCGQQCGINLKVKNNKVIGFEPREDFPFNRGKLCPKGILRYLQNEHPDRLLSPMKRVEGKGFERISWDEALDTTVQEIQRIEVGALQSRMAQQGHGERHAQHRPDLARGLVDRAADRVMRHRQAAHRRG